MASGCPVVCSKINIFQEIYHQAAFYFDPQNVDSIRQVINQVVNLKKEKRRKIIKKGKKQAEKYSWKKCAQQTLKIYQEAVRC